MPNLPKLLILFSYFIDEETGSEHLSDLHKTVQITSIELGLRDFMIVLEYPSPVYSFSLFSLLYLVALLRSSWFFGSSANWKVP